MTEREVYVKFGARTGELDLALKDLAASIRGRSQAIETSLKGIGDEAQRTERRTEAAASGMAGAFRRSVSGLTGAASGIAGVFSSLYRSVFSVQTAIVGLIGGGLVATVKAALSAAAAVKDVAAAADISTSALQELRFAAGQNGASAEVMDDALVKLTKNLGTFRTEGAGPAAKALEFLGLAQAVTRNEFANSDEAFMAVLRKLAEVPVAADRAALASDLFGKSAGPKLAQLLALGEEGLRRAREEAHRLGLVLTDDMIDKADEAEDALNALWENLKMTGVSAVASNAEAIRKLAEEFAAAMPGIIEWLKEAAKYWGILDRTPGEIVTRNLEATEDKLADQKRYRDAAAKRGTPWTEDSPGMVQLRQLEQDRRFLLSKLTDEQGRNSGASVERYSASVADQFKWAADVQGKGGIVSYKKPPAPRPLYEGVDPEGAGAGGRESAEVSLARSAAQQKIEIERDTELQKLGIWRQSIDARHGLGKMADWLYLAQARLIAEQEYAIKQKAIQDQLAVENLKPQQRLQLQGQLEQLELEHQAKMADIGLEAERLKDEARRERVEKEKAANAEVERDRQRIAGETEGFINRLLSGQINAQNVLQMLAQQAQQYFAKMVGQRVATAIAGEQAETAARSGWGAIRAALTAGEAKASLGAQIGKALKSIAIAAQETFANVYAFMSPFMGPLAVIPAGVAAAAVGAASLLLPSAAGGTEVQRDGLHFLHEREVVLPAKWSQRLAGMADALGGNPRAPAYRPLPSREEGGNGGAGGQFGSGINFTVHAVDAGSVTDLFRRYGHEIGGAIHRMAADGHIKPT